MMAFSTRFSYAFRCFFSLLFGGTIPPDIGERNRRKRASKCACRGKAKAQ